MKVVTSLDEVDEKLQEAARAGSDTELRRVFASFRMDFSGQVPADPFSPAYFDAQMALYHRMAGRPYAAANEVTGLDPGAAALRPFPFTSGSTATAGQHLGALGFVLARMPLPPGSTVLEFGPGWGNTTMALAQLGLRVTAVDIEPNFCELLRRRAAMLKVEVEVLQDEFFLCERIGRQFDAVLFYECFHHCADHMRLLRGLHRVVKPGGRVYLGCEPILHDFPLPWGLRMDGESLWAVRQNGWMELGFNTAYFRDALAATGWFGRFERSADVGFANLCVLERTQGEQLSIQADDARIQTLTGTKQAGTLLLRDGDGGYLLYGPYLVLAAGDWTAAVGLVPGVPRHGQVRMDVCHGASGSVDAARAILLDDHPGDVLELAFHLPWPATQVEVRLECDPGTTVQIAGVSFVPR